MSLVRSAETVNVEATAGTPVASSEAAVNKDTATDA
jgi:hypothetical protein